VLSLSLFFQVDIEAGDGNQGIEPGGDKLDPLNGASAFQRYRFAGLQIEKDLLAAVNILTYLNIMFSGLKLYGDGFSVFDGCSSFSVDINPKSAKTAFSLVNAFDDHESLLHKTSLERLLIKLFSSTIIGIPALSVKKEFETVNDAIQYGIKEKDVIEWKLRKRRTDESLYFV